MEPESIYTDKEVTRVAKKVAEHAGFMSDTPPRFRGRQWSKGPLALFSELSSMYASDGVGIEIAALTMRQRSIIIELVGKAMKKASKEYEKNNPEKPFIIEHEPFSERMSKGEFEQFEKRGERFTERWWDKH